MTPTDVFHYLYHLRRALQALAALTSEEGLCDVAAGLDEIAALAWKVVRQ